MKKRFEKQYQEVCKSVAKMLSQNPTENEAIYNLAMMPRKQRRLLQRFSKKQEKTQNEKTNSGKPDNVPPSL